MSYPYSPTRLIDARSAMVRIDKPIRECVLEGGCPPGRHCPLDGCIEGRYTAYRKSSLWEMIDR